MTASPPIPVAEATPAMSHPSDTTAEARSEQAVPVQAPTSAVRPRLRDQIADNPLLTLFGTIIVALLVFILGGTNLRIGDINGRIDDINDRIDDINGRIDDLNGRIDDVNERIDDLHDRIDETNDRIDRLEDRFASLEQRVIEIDLKLTALLAALNATETVDAALQGRLLQSDADDRGSQPGREPPDG